MFLSSESSDFLLCKFYFVEFVIGCFYCTYFKLVLVLSLQVQYIYLRDLSWSFVLDLDSFGLVLDLDFMGVLNYYFVLCFSFEYLLVIFLFEYSPDLRIYLLLTFFYYYLLVIIISFLSLIYEYFWGNRNNNIKNLCHIILSHNLIFILKLPWIKSGI